MCTVPTIFCKQLILVDPMLVESVTLVPFNSWTPSQIVVMCGVFNLLAFTVWKLIVRPRFWDPLRWLPGPPRSSLVFGNEQDISYAARGDLFNKWFKEHGCSLLRYHSYFGRRVLLVKDRKVIKHILSTKPFQWRKPTILKAYLQGLAGKSVITTEDKDEHRHIKKIIAPALSSGNLLPMATAFEDKGRQLVSVLRETLLNTAAPIDVVSYLGEAAFDTTSLVSLHRDYNTTNRSSTENVSLFELLKGLEGVPIMEVKSHLLMGLVSASDRLTDLLLCLHSESIQRRKLVLREVMLAMEEGSDPHPAINGRVFLPDSLNLKGGAPEIASASLLAFMVAALYMSSNTLAWALHRLTQHFHVQDKLRQELQSNNGDLFDLPYLDAVIREVFRLHPPFTEMRREAIEDQFLTLERPITNQNGTSTEVIEVKVGDEVVISITAFNQDPDIFGQDASSFRPERWLEKSYAPTMGTAFNPLLTFSAGPRYCPGARLSSMQIKGILGHLVKNFVFSSTKESDTTIGRNTGLLTQPMPLGKEDEPSQLLLNVQPIKAFDGC